jgi:hypothetical protein
MYSQELHWRMAASWGRMSFTEFLALDGSEMSRVVAAYETQMQLEAVVWKDRSRPPKQVTKKR